MCVKVLLEDYLKCHQKLKALKEKPTQRDAQWSIQKDNRKLTISVRILCPIVSIILYFNFSSRLLSRFPVIFAPGYCYALFIVLPRNSLRIFLKILTGSRTQFLCVLSDNISWNFVGISSYPLSGTGVPVIEFHFNCGIFKKKYYLTFCPDSL